MAGIPVLQDKPQVTVGPSGNGGEPASAASQKGGYINYLGGPVITAPQVFLIFWGSWWVSNGSSEQKQLTAFFEGLGGKGDKWSTIANQYYYTQEEKDHQTITSYPDLGSGPVLLGDSAKTGSIVDPTDPPQSPTEDQLAAEAALTWQVSATAAKNPNTTNLIPIVVTPSGVISSYDVQHNNACGHHNWNYYYSKVVSMYQPFPWAEVSYDMASRGSSKKGDFGCNYGTRTSGGLTIGAGHEFLESVTDPFPPDTGTPQTDPSGQSFGLEGGWINPDNGDPSGEIGDACRPDNVDTVFPLKLSTGTFSVQEIWSNAKHGCVKSS